MREHLLIDEYQKYVWFYYVRKYFCYILHKKKSILNYIINYFTSQ